MAHGSHISKVIAPSSKSYQGPFGRLCGELAPWVPRDKDCKEIREHEIDKHFQEFANSKMIEREGMKPRDLLDPATIVELDEEFGTKGKFPGAAIAGIPAGYTYFGQFVDHDITFDPASSLVRQNDPNSLLNFRTPRLDLDNLYGRGPHDQPYMFELLGNKAERKRREKLGAFSFVIGEVSREFKRDARGDPVFDAKGNPVLINAKTKYQDLPRQSLPSSDKDRAIIGDMRNDENAIVSQMQLAFLKAHNTLLERALDAGSCTPFEDAKRTLRWLYQWIVWNDFVKRITQAHPGVHQTALQLKEDVWGARRWDLGLKHVYNWKHQPFMPVEFAVAAYRFGHSMVRNAYRTNFIRGFEDEDHAPLFDTSEDGTGDLRGFREMVKENVIQWDWFLPMKSSRGPFPQRARKIDTKLANALAFLAGEERPNNILAYRNLKRGWTFGLPRGTDVAKKYVCGDVIELSPEEPDSLWYYVLKEAETRGSDGESLGPLGATLICAVFAGLLKGDPQSWVTQSPCWTPASDPLLQGTVKQFDGSEVPINEDGADGAYELASIIRLAGVPVNGGDFRP